jgi:NAD(P) transhydrogenase subunit alpha
MSLRLAVLNERANGETRIAAAPETVRRFIAPSVSAPIETGAGPGATISDTDFSAAGAEVAPAAEVVPRRHGED